MSGDDLFRIGYSDLDALHDNLRQGQRRLQTQLDNLKQYISRFTADWEGEALTSYQARQAQWDQAAADLDTILGNIATAVAEAVPAVKQSDSNAASLFQ